MKVNFPIGKSLALNDILDKEFEEKGSEDSDSDDDSEPEDKWDCDTILTTHTNTDNHPGVIKTTRVVKPKRNTIELHKQLRVPIEGLAAELVDNRSHKKDVSQKVTA